MSLASAAINRWQLSLVLFFLLGALGLTAFFAIPRSVDPHFPIPVVFVVASQPGADAADMEETVAKPIEEMLQGLDDVIEIESTSGDGSAVIAAEFDWGGDPDRYFDDVVREVSAARDRLPPDLAGLDFRKVRTADTATLQLALISETASWRRIEKFADDLRDRLSPIDRVQSVLIQGLPRPEVSVSIDSGRMAELKLAPGAVADALRQGSLDVSGGAVQSGARRFNIDAGGAFRDLESIRRLPVRAGDGSLLSVGALAEVGWAAEEQRVRTRHNGKRAVIITVQPKDGVDVTSLRNRLMTEIDEYRADLPPDFELAVQFDQSRDIGFRMAELARDFAIALGLVTITLLPLGPRASAIVMVSIPLSLASGLLALFLAGHNLNQLSIAGFILSLGLLVDDSIVVTENIARHLRMGKNRARAAIEATREITPAVLGSTGVLLFAFFPLLFIPEGPGRYIESFVWAVLFTVSASLAISLSIIPFFASRVLRREPHPEGNVVLRTLNRGIERFYRPLLHRALAAPKRTLVGAMAITIGAFALVPMLGFSLFPMADASYFRVTVEAEEGSSLERTTEIVDRVSAVLAAEAAIESRAETIGAGNPQVFYNVYNNIERTDYAETLAVLDRWDSEESPRLIARLRDRLDRIPGAVIRVVQFQNGSPVEAPVAIRARGDDLDELRAAAATIESVLERTPGARDIQNSLAAERIDFDMNIDARRAALLDIPPGAPRRALKLALSGERAGTFRDEEGDNYPVVVRLPLDGSQPVSALEQIYVHTRAGRPVALAQISDPRLEAVTPRIKRFDLERVAVVTAQVEQGSLPASVTAEALEQLDDMRFPPGVELEIGGEADQLGSTFAGLGPVILVALFGIFAILVWEFRGFRETIVVAGVIPLGTFGGILMLLFTGNSLSFTSTIGFVALIGIEIKNSILLVDFTAQLRERGMALREAVERAGEVRFLPVLLTSITAIGGLTPLALWGGNLYGPLAQVIIGGLISSTLLSRIVTPVMYLLIVRGARRGEGGEPEPASPTASEPV